MFLNLEDLEMHYREVRNFEFFFYQLNTKNKKQCLNSRPEIGSTIYIFMFWAY